MQHNQHRDIHPPRICLKSKKRWIDVNKLGYNPKSNIAAPPTPTHNVMRMLLERETPPEGLSCASSVGGYVGSNVGSSVGCDVGSSVGCVVGSTIGLPVGAGVVGEEVGWNKKND